MKNKMPLLRFILVFSGLYFFSGTIAQPTHDPMLSLPWTEGQKWWLHHGAHTSNGSGPYSSLDFAPAPGASTAVRAARGGWVIPISDCLDQAMVMLNHSDGWYTSYYHLKNVPLHIQNPSGNVWVERGEFIGNVETDAASATPCNTGSWTRPHVHMTLRTGTGSAADQYASLIGKKIGGWEVLDDFPNQERKSGLQKDGYTIHRPTSYNDFSPGSMVYNDGAIGTGDFATYSHCRNYQLEGVFVSTEKVPVKATHDIYTNALFSNNSDARIVAGKRIVLQSGFRIFAGAKVKMISNVFYCSSNPNATPDSSEEPNLELRSIPEVPEEVSIKISPSPFDDFFKLEWTATPQAGVIGFALVDINGQVLHREDWASQPTYWGQKELGHQNNQLASLPPGIYLVQILLENGRMISQKIAKL